RTRRLPDETDAPAPAWESAGGAGSSPSALPTARAAKWFRIGCQSLGKRFEGRLRVRPAPAPMLRRRASSPLRRFQLRLAFSSGYIARPRLKALLDFAERSSQVLAQISVASVDAFCALEEGPRLCALALRQIALRQCNQRFGEHRAFFVEVGFAPRQRIP